MASEYVSEIEGHPPGRDLDEIPLLLGQDGGDSLQDARLTTLDIRADLTSQTIGQIHAQTCLNSSEKYQTI